MKINGWLQPPVRGVLDWCVAVLVFWGVPVQAQFSVLHEFDGVGGKAPFGSFVEGPGGLYGVTCRGGAFNYGIIYRYDPIAPEFQVLHSFDGTSGRFPYNSLIVDEQTVYGVTRSGGSSNAGVLYSLELVTLEYRVLHHFVSGDDDGAYPYTAPVVHAGELYGLAFQGGASGMGCIYRYDLDARAFAVLFSFDAESGKNPFGAMTLIDNWFYGMTSDYLDPERYGTIFRIRPDGSGYQTLHRFGGGSLGGYPYDSLVFDGATMLYGTTLGSYSDLSDEGVVFRYNIGTGQYEVLHDFAVQRGDGAKPNGNPVLSPDGTELYCLTHGTQVWGTLDDSREPGTLVAMNVDGSDFKVLHTFSGGYEGDVPTRTPLLRGNTVCGVCVTGGAPQTSTHFYWEARGYGLMWKQNLPSTPTAARIATFGARRTPDGCVSIVWRTLVEAGIQGYYLDRSEDGVRWRRICDFLIPANDTSGVGGEYAFVDTVDGLRDATLYRVLSVELDGSVKTLATTRIESSPRIRLSGGNGFIELIIQGRPRQAVRWETSSGPGETAWESLGTPGVVDLEGFSRLRVSVHRDEPVRVYRAVLDGH